MAVQQQHLQHRGQDAAASFNSFLQEKRPSTSQVLAVVTLFPVGGFLLCIAGLTFIASLIGLVVTAPLFVIFSPVLVPAALVIGLAVTGFLASGSFGLTALSSLSWIVNHFRRSRRELPERMEDAKRRMQEATGQVGQKAREVGPGVQSKAHEGVRT
ncbi:hypothetical protein Nepgr_003097 [Nepenthes gracilis]|uniref:Oleosin n=1 Tax=Nepenthes gracilis TaxID=150966 RepID=A0AAD3XCX5_NEPGR|nr:hypothetical protein Nepgr_003097 [Nepenthes gracilis]